MLVQECQIFAWIHFFRPPLCRYFFSGQNTSTYGCISLFDRGSILCFALECEESFSLPKLSQFESILKAFVAALNMSHSHIAKFILKRFQINFAVVDVFAHKKTTLAMAQGSLKHKQDVGVERLLQHEMFGLGYFPAFLVFFLLFKKTQAYDCGNLRNLYEGVQLETSCLASTAGRFNPGRSALRAVC